MASLATFYADKQIMEDLAMEVPREIAQSSEIGGVIVCKEYAIIVSWIDCNTQQLMEDLALDVQREMTYRFNR
ncbi:hypothetical protein KY289_037190 [Solanum tuberosum]|nr:hypothetical protein KY289_037190 [Solanum tuberosum]